MRTSQRLLLIALLSTPFAMPITGRGDAVPGHHGGQVQDAGPYHIELVAKPNELTLYVTGPGTREVETKGATGTATILSDKTKETVPLAPAGENVLRGAAKFDIARGAKVVVSVTFPGQTAVQARFAPMQKGTE